MGKEIHSAALIADGHHARVDGFTSLTVLGGAIAWDSAKSVFLRVLDGGDPTVLDEIAHTSGHVEGVVVVSDVRARWSGHRLEAHQVGLEVSHTISHSVPFIAHAIVHVDPMCKAGLVYHHTEAREHDGFPLHAH